jgi:hypothetical protein
MSIAWSRRSFITFATAVAGCAETPTDSREVATHLVGVEVGLGEEVAHAGERDLPAVARRAEELLEHRQVQVLGLDPAVEVGDVGRARLGEDPVGGDVGVLARRDLAEDLEHRVLAVEHRRVRLLAAEHRAVGVGHQVVVAEAHEPERPVAARLQERPEEPGHRRPVVQRVVGVPPAVLGLLPPADEGVVEPSLRVGVERERQLVELLLPVVVAQGHEVHDDDRLVRSGRVPDGPEASYVGHLEPATLAAEPPGVGDELPQVPRPAPGLSHLRSPADRSSRGRSGGTSRTRGRSA